MDDGLGAALPTIEDGALRELTDSCRDAVEVVQMTVLGRVVEGQLSAAWRRAHRVAIGPTHWFDWTWSPKQALVSNEPGDPGLRLVAASA